MKYGKICQMMMMYLDCPCEVLEGMVDDDPITEALHNARIQGQVEGFTPLLILPCGNLLEAISIACKTPQNIHPLHRAQISDYRRSVLEEAATLDGAGLLQERAKEYWDEIKSYEPDFSTGEFVPEEEGTNCFYSYWNYDTAVTKPVILAKIPTIKPYEVAAWVPMGGFNDCPSPAEQVAIFRYWYEKRGAIPALVTYNTWEFSAPNPPATNEDAEMLAMEHFGASFDNIAQAEEGLTIRQYASGLKNSSTWFFWWD